MTNYACINIDQGQIFFRIKNEGTKRSRILEDIIILTNYDSLE